MKENQISVVHIIGGGEIGGAEQHVLQLATHLQANGVSPHVVCLFPEPFYQMLQQAGVPSSVVAMHHKLDLGALLRLSTELRRIQPQIVHTHGVRANLLGRLAARRSGVQVVVTTIHSVLAQDYPSRMSRMANALTENATSGISDHFIAVSNYIKEYLVASGIPEARVSVIYNGIDTAHWQPWAGDRSFRQEHRIPLDVPLFAIIARLHPVKGHRFFLAAASQVLKQYPMARFAVVGSGLYWQEIEALIRKYDLEKSCISTGYLEELGPVYAALDGLVISSLSEGFGLTALEAFALSKPVIATSVGAIPELISDGENGLLVPPADEDALARAMIRLLANPLEARRLGQQGRELLERKFSLSQTVAATASLYRKLLKS